MIKNVTASALLSASSVLSSGADSTCVAFATGDGEGVAIVSGVARKKHCQRKHTNVSRERRWSCEGQG